MRILGLEKIALYKICVSGTVLMQNIPTCALWQYGLWSFQTGGTKLERFLPKNQHTQRKLLNFENWISGSHFKRT